MSTRQLPIIDLRGEPSRSISFVCVRFSDDFLHNLARSPCVSRPGNELLAVENAGNVSFETLSAAIESGVERATGDLIAVVHEDVLLPEGWQLAAERSLDALERHDPSWAIAGVAGWTPDGKIQGHWSDPRVYRNLLGSRPFLEVARIDEQLILMPRDRRLRFDVELPSIHNIGHDLALQAAAKGSRCYVVNAPTIHKYARADGAPILTAEDSPKIAARSSYTHRADRACSDEYFLNKWPGVNPLGVPPGAVASEESGRTDEVPGLDGPVVLLARGGGGSRLLSALARDLGIFTGTDLNPAGDTLELVLPIYKFVLTLYRRHAPWQIRARRAELRLAANEMLARGKDVDLWGFKLPESLLIVDQIAEVFPRARFVHMVRDPLATCLRRTHMTARLDNQVGQAALLAAYRWLGRPVASILSDPPAMNMAVTTRHQISLVLRHASSLPAERYGEIRFEDLFRDHSRVHDDVAEWLGAPTSGGAPGGSLGALLDPARASARPAELPAPELAEIEGVLSELRRQLGYGSGV